MFHLREVPRQTQTGFNIDYTLYHHHLLYSGFSKGIYYRLHSLPIIPLLPRLKSIDITNRP